jgi:hypothetical protein
MFVTEAAARRIGGIDPIAETIDAATDLTIRKRVHRGGLRISASLVLNRIDREGPTRLTVLAVAEGISQR